MNSETPPGYAALTAHTALTALIADDDKELRELMAETMEELGYKSIVVNDGKACIDKIKEGVPVDVVFLDLKMAPQDGLTTLKLIRSMTTPARYLPVFMLTGYVDDRIIAAAKALGAADYLVKPVDPSRLQERIRAKVPESTSLVDHKETLSTIYFEDKNLIASIKDAQVATGFKAYPMTRDEEKWLYLVRQELGPRAALSLKPEKQVTSIAIYKRGSSSWRCVWPSYRQYAEAMEAAKKPSAGGILGELGIA